MTASVGARPSAKVTLYDRTTGAAILRWPVDAGELLATGGYTTDPLPLADARPAVPLAPAATPDTVSDVLPGLEAEDVRPTRRRRSK